MPAARESRSEAPAGRPVGELRGVGDDAARLAHHLLLLEELARIYDSTGHLLLDPVLAIEHGPPAALQLLSLTLLRSSRWLRLRSRIPPGPREPASPSRIP